MKSPVSYYTSLIFYNEISLIFVTQKSFFFHFFKKKIKYIRFLHEIMINTENFLKITQQVAQYNASLIAVTKTRSISAIKAIYAKEQRDFGENRVQELVQKQKELPNDVRWHLIGHLQSNKVKQIAPFIHLIHSVDSLKLLKEIDKEAQKNGRIIKCLLQIYIAKESSKYGLDENELNEILIRKSQKNDFQYIELCGLMGMATFTNDQALIAQEFSFLKQLFEKVKVSYKLIAPSFNEISMGMSSDYQIALENGSTMIRVGSALFS